MVPSHHLVGLELDCIRNPVEVYAMLHGAKSHPIAELLDLDLASSSEEEEEEEGEKDRQSSRHLASLDFKCRCTAKSIDDQLESRRRCQTRKVSFPTSKQTKQRVMPPHIELPDSEMQLAVLGKLTRSSLARGLARRLRAGRTTLYKLDEICRQANDMLGRQLERWALQSGRKLIQIGEVTSMDSLAGDDETEQDDVMVRAPVGRQENNDKSRAVNQRLNLMHLSGESNDSGIVCQASDDDLQPGGDEFKGCQVREKVQLTLEQLIAAKSRPQIRALVAYSLDLFDEVLAGNALFQLETNVDCIVRDAESELNLHGLRLFACIECQNMRSIIRFHWIPKCLLLLLAPAPAPARGQQNCNDSLPELARLWDLQEGKRHLDLVARLMSNLVRQHFLEPALATFVGQFESLLLAQSSHEQPLRSRIVKRVELVETDDQQHQQVTGGPKLTWNEPTVELKQTMAFIVDELARICKDLPRLEAQLGSAEHPSASQGPWQFPPWQEAAKGEEEDKSSSGIEFRENTLQTDNQDLVEAAKLKLNGLIDDSCRLLRLQQSAVEAGAGYSLANLNGSTKQDDDDDGQSTYFLVLDVVNKFRAGFFEDEHPNEQSGPSLLHLDQQDARDDRLARLNASHSQIRALNKLEFLLQCKLERYFDCGRLILLDFEPLRRALLRSVRKERHLIVRLNMDGILRSLEQVRLQFDDVEIALDLESAIDEYLALKWQAKQSQQQQHQSAIILAGADVGDDDGVGEPFFDESIFMPNDDNLPPDDQQQDTAPKQPDEDEMEKFAESTLVDESAAINAQHLAALSTAAAATTHKELAKTSKAPSGEPSADQRRVSQLVECRLLNEKYVQYGRFVNKELGPMLMDLRVSLESLVFLTEFIGSAEQIESQREELIQELATRAREFSQILSESLRRLNGAKLRLLSSNQSRSKILSKLMHEFHRLTQTLAGRRLTGDSQASETNENNIKQLDAIQEASDLAQKLEMRFDYLEKQNTLLQKEAQYLREASISGQMKSNGCSSAANLLQPISQVRADVLGQWAPIVASLAAMWRLVEDFETQQVKWLNSDVKRIDFDQMKAKFNEYVARLETLAQSSIHNDTLDLNLAEIRRRLKEFESTKMAMLKFLTNSYLGPSHWTMLAECLDDESASLAAKATTLHQFQEQISNDLIDKLEQISRKATVEHQLGVFLLREANKTRTVDEEAGLSVNVDEVDWLEGWSEDELTIAACRFMELKLNNEQPNQPAKTAFDLMDLSSRLVRVHSTVRRYLFLQYSLDLANLPPSYDPKTTLGDTLRRKKQFLVTRSCQKLSNYKLLRPFMFIEFLRLFSLNLIEEDTLNSNKIVQLEEDLEFVTENLDEIEKLVGRVEQIEASDLNEASIDIQQNLVAIEQQTSKLELEREILATKEAMSLEKQRNALEIRDDCIKQITERAIPAIRAALKALESLNEKAFKALHFICRPRPPEPVRLVIEAVCLLRGSLTMDKNLHPERRFDAVSGKIIEDYWPMASRMINGTHSSKFLADLRSLDKKSLPQNVMKLIRRRYLASAHFRLPLITRVSPEAALLAKWITSVDIFDRIMNVVKPNYQKYLEAELEVNALRSSSERNRKDIEAICKSLQERRDLHQMRIRHKMSLVDSLDSCSRQLRQVESTRVELALRQRSCRVKLAKLRRKQVKLIGKCMMEAAKRIYLDVSSESDKISLQKLMRREMPGLEKNRPMQELNQRPN